MIVLSIIIVLEVSYMLIVVGSRREGNSFNLANIVKRKLEEERINTNIIVPGNQRIHICTGCMDCDKSGVCDFTDDMKSNIDLINKEKVIMFISPTRWNCMSGDLKIFMDRLNPLYSNHGLKGKKAIVVSIGAQGKDVYSTSQCTYSLRSFIEASEMDFVLSHEFYNCKNFEDILMHGTEIEDFIKEVKNIAKEN